MIAGLVAVGGIAAGAPVALAQEAIPPLRIPDLEGAPSSAQDRAAQKAAQDARDAARKKEADKRALAKKQAALEAEQKEARETAAQLKSDQARLAQQAAEKVKADQAKLSKDAAAQKAEQARLASEQARLAKQSEELKAQQAKLDARAAELAAEEKRIAQLRTAAEVERAELAKQRQASQQKIVERPIAERPPVAERPPIVQPEVAVREPTPRRYAEAEHDNEEPDDPADVLTENDRSLSDLRARGPSYARINFATAERSCVRMGQDAALDRNYYSARYDAAPHFYEDGGWELRGRMRLEDRRGYVLVDTICEVGADGRALDFRFLRQAGR